MKIKSLYALFILVIITFACWMLYAHDRAQTLNAQLTASGLLPSDLTAQKRSANLNGSALVLYDIEHPDYPQLKIKRGQFQNNSTHLVFLLKGIHGNLFEYLQQTQLHSFKKQLDQYNPSSDLITSPFITLAVLGETDLNLDLSIEGIKTAPNQITIDLIVWQNNQQKIHFSAKLTPKYTNASLFDNLRAQKISMQLEQICPEWKQKLDDYSLSKNKPFVTENSHHDINF